MMTESKSVSVKVLTILMTVVLLLSMFGTLTVSAVAVQPTTLVLQNLTKWKSYTYGGGNLYDTGCGMFSIVNAVGYLTGNEMSVTEVASWGHSIGGYNPGTSGAGTYRMTVYPRLQAKYGTRYGFTVDCGSTNEGYWEGSGSTTLKNHLTSGGVAIGHVPGHFIAVVGYDPNTNYFHVYDSYPTTARGTGNGDAWVTQSRLNTGKLKLDWFCLLTRTGTVINNQAVSSSYTVTFDSRGGSAVPSQKVQEGAYATDPGAPTREGFEFLGWYEENGWEFSFGSTAIWGDRTLHAEWKAVSWPLSTDYMPTQTNTVAETYAGGGEAYVWPHYNGYSGAATLYKGGKDFGWPSVLSTYQTSVDLSTHAYWNLSISATAAFNATLIFRDVNYVQREAKLSQIVNGNDNDFAAGDYTITANVGNYLYANFAMPANSIVNIEAIRYFVVGSTDQYVSINNVLFTGEMVHTDTMLPDTLAQEATAGACGAYTYENGVLSVEGTGGYKVDFYPNVTFAPKERPYWIVSASADTNYDISMVVTTSDGDRVVTVRDDFYNMLGYSELPQEGLASGVLTKAFNILGMYEWHGILPADGNSIIKKVSVELRGNGRVILKANQMSNTPVPYYITDTVVKSDQWMGDIAINNNDYVIDVNTSDVLVTKREGFTVGETKNAMNNSQYVQIFDGDNRASDTAMATTGMTVKVVNDDQVLSEYVLAIHGDVNCDGVSNSSDVRKMLVALTQNKALSVAAETAADMDADGQMLTQDARALLLELLAKI